MSILLISDTHYNCSEYNQIALYNMLYEVKDMKFDAVVHCGDWISHDIEEFPKILKLIRFFIRCPILAVLGNHDIWHLDKSIEYSDLMAYIRKQFKKFDIQYLPDNYFSNKDYNIVGYDGWYCNPNPPSNDASRSYHFIEGADIHRYLSNKSNKEFDLILDKLDSFDDGKIKICCSHFHPSLEFGCNPKMTEILSEKCDYILYGHSHKKSDKIQNDCRIYNCGSDYEYPRYMII